MVPGLGLLSPAEQRERPAEGYEEGRVSRSFAPDDHFCLWGA